MGPTSGWTVCWVDVCAELLLLGVAAMWSWEGRFFLREAHVVENTSGTTGAGAPVVLKAHLLAGWAHGLLTLPAAASLSLHGCLKGMVVQDHR